MPQIKSSATMNQIPRTCMWYRESLMFNLLIKIAFLIPLLQTVWTDSSNSFESNILLFFHAVGFRWKQQEREHYEYIVVEGKIVHKQSGIFLDTIKGKPGAKWIFVMSTSKKLYAGPVSPEINTGITCCNFLPFSILPQRFGSWNINYFQKKKGVFHHSSFIAGGATLAAGRLEAEDGTLKVTKPH